MFLGDPFADTLAFAVGFAERANFADHSVITNHSSTAHHYATDDRLANLHCLAHDRGFASGDSGDQPATGPGASDGRPAPSSQ
jgi:hypothetical protein